MAKERANLVGGFGRKDVLELAGLLFDFGFAVHGKAVGEQALSKTVPANDVSGALTPAGREFDNHAAVAGRDSSRLQCVVARINERLVIMRLGRMRSRGDQTKLDHLFYGDAHRERAVHFHALQFRDLAMFGQCPKFFQHFVKLFFIGHGEDFLNCDLAMMQFNAAVGEAGDDGVVRHHHDGSSLLMQFA